MWDACAHRSRGTRRQRLQLHQRKRTGQIREGFAADLIVVGPRSPARRAQAGSEAKVELTMVNGRIVHGG